MYIYTEYARTIYIYINRQFSVYTTSVGRAQRAPINRQIFVLPTSVGLTALAPVTPPIDPTPNLSSNLNIHSTVNAHSNSCANQNAGLLTKQNLGGKWSRPFCSRPQVGSSKRPKPGHAMTGKDTLLKTSVFLFCIFLSISPKNVCHNCPTHLSCKCPTH